MEHLWQTWQFTDFIDKFFQQLLLVSISLLCAILLGVPLGIMARQWVKIRTLLFAATNIIQTIPSLALLAMLLPLCGIGFIPAFIALTLYAILPIVRNTYAGLTQISPLLIEVANALGFTAWQRLWFVEFPLSATFIVAGIRTATTMTVGIATIAAFIGAGGLGDFINRGLAMNDNHLLLLGAIPAALLALLLDSLFSFIEKKLNYLSPHFHSHVYRHTLQVIFSIFLFFTGIGVYYHLQQPPLHQQTIRIATKNFTEQNILGEIMAQLITAKTHLHVIRKFNLGSTQICQAAMQRGDIDIYPEYSGTAYMTVMHQTTLLPPDILFNTVKNYYAQHFKILWLSPFGFNNAQSLTLSQSLAQNAHITTISDLILFAPQLRLGVPSEFVDRLDGLPRLQQGYQLHFQKIIGMEPGLMYRAIAHHQVDVINAFTTDGRISAYHLQILQDDRHVFPAYQAAPLIRMVIVQQYPQLAPLLNQLANKISDQTMRTMNAAVELHHQSTTAVARQFLQQQHLI